MSRSIRASAWLTCGVILLGSPALGQGEFDRAKPFKQRHDPLATPTPITSKVPTHKPGTPRTDSDVFTPEELEKFFPRPQEPEAKPKEPSWIELKLGGKAFTSFGYDSNVFRSESSRTEDGFFRGHAEADILGRLRNGGEIFLEVTGETLLYFERTRANEHFVSTFLEYFQPATDWLELGVQNAFEWSRLNLLDDNGDLFPRGRFGSLDEEVRLFVIMSPPVDDDPSSFWQWRNLALETGGSFRLKNYEENTGVDSLDYQELRFDTAISYRISRRPRARIKLKYRFRRRDYREFRSRSRAGAVGPGEPHLDLQRHQLNLRYFQDIQVGEVKARLTFGVGGAYNRDLHENDRSYREVSASFTAEWWILPRTTRLDLGLRALARNFIVRKRQVRDPTTGSDVPGGGRLRHRLLRFRLGLWQRLLQTSTDDEGGRRKTGFTVAAFTDASITVWRSGDFDEDYDRYVWQAGLEATW